MNAHEHESANVLKYALLSVHVGVMAMSWSIAGWGRSTCVNAHETESANILKYALLSVHVGVMAMSWIIAGWGRSTCECKSSHAFMRVLVHELVSGQRHGTTSTKDQ